MNMNKDLTLKELLISCLDGDDRDAPQTNRKTPDCPSFREFEAHAKGVRFLGADALRHVNRCTEYCQPLLERFRHHCSDNQVQFSTGVVERLAALGSGGAARTYDAVVESRRGEILGPATIVLNDGPFLTEDDRVVFRMSVSEPHFQPEMLPIRVSMADFQNRLGQASHILTFDLPTQAGEVIKMKIPQELLFFPEWKNIDQTGHLPVHFVVSPLGHCELIS